MSNLLLVLIKKDTNRLHEYGMNSYKDGIVKSKPEQKKLFETWTNFRPNAFVKMIINEELLPVDIKVLGSCNLTELSDQAYRNIVDIF